MSSNAIRTAMQQARQIEARLDAATFNTRKGPRSLEFKTTEFKSPDYFEGPAFSEPLMKVTVPALLADPELGTIIFNGEEPIAFLDQNVAQNHGIDRAEFEEKLQGAIEGTSYRNAKVRWIE